jgi:hypothetical protein
MRFHMTRLILSAMIIVLSASTASALDLNANVFGIFTDSSFSTAVADAVIDSEGNATATLAAGQGVIISIDVANPSAESIQTMFSTLTTNGAQIAEVLGASLPPTMLKGPAFLDKAMSDVGTGGVKGNTPVFPGTAGELWIQGTGYALQVGATGTGVDQILILLILGDVAGDEFVDFAMGETSGDSITFPTAVNFDGATINAPEPASIALALTSLGTIGLIARVRRRA